MKYVLVGSGQFSEKSNFKKYAKKCKVIACDGGIDHCRKDNIVPDIMVGDFDSATNENYIYCKNMGVEEIKFPTHKDMTDMEIGMDLALQYGADEIYIFGGIGSRLDHSLGNVHLMCKSLKEGVKAFLINEDNTVTLVDKSIEINTHRGQTVSLIPLTTTVEGVTTVNLEYALNNATMTIGSTLGISNVATEDTISISVKNGILIVFLSQD